MALQLVDELMQSIDGYLDPKTTQTSKQSKPASTLPSDYKSIVHSRYSATARNFDTVHTAEEQQKLRSIMEAFGYSQEELEEIGKDANLGLSCGNPVKQAKLKKGEAVLDLGCGAGMDLFLARKYIGESSDGGKLLGVDFSEDMIERARRNAANKKYDTSHFKFMHSEIENMHKVVADESIDCVISNCVLNLVADKAAAFKEIYRVLKPNGGRICVSDIAMKKQLPACIKNDITAVVNCVAGAILDTEYQRLLKEAGFKHVQMMNKNVDLNVWKDSWETMVSGGGADETASCCSAAPSKTAQKTTSCCSAAPAKKPAASGCCGGGGDETASAKATNCCSAEPAKKAAASGCCGGGDAAAMSKRSKADNERIRKMIQAADLNDYVASYYVFAVK